MKLNRIACQFVDASDSRPIPLVVASSTDNTTVISDNAGFVVMPVNLPARTSYYLSVASPGYEITADGFDNRGIRLRVGDSPKIVKLVRQNIAQRSGRITGTGKYIHAQALGKYLDVTEQPLTGMDSVQSVSLNGKRYVFYGDTNWTGYPLGNFKTTNGIVHRKPLSLPNCPYSITFNIDETGNAKGSVRTRSDLPGVVWISGVVQVGATIVAYANHRKSLQTQLDHGFVQWNIKSQTFDNFVSLPETSWKHLDGHPFNVRDNGISYIMFGHAIPNFRVLANVASIRSSSEYETYTCLQMSGDIERAPDGKAVWRWRGAGTPIDAQREIELLREGKLRRDECRYILTEHQSRRTVVPHRGSTRWNQYLKRWLLVFTAINEPDSMLGELYLASGTTPLGPWTDCIKVATHPKYSFYNPVHHDWLDQKSGRIITIEGTYTLTFSGSSVPTPGYEYNQLAYEVDLADTRLAYLRSAKPSI